MKLDLKILVWGGDYNEETLILPDEGIICETSYVHMGNDYVTGYIYVTSNTEEHKQTIKPSFNSYICFTPTQIVVFLDRCRIESEVKLSTLDELNAYMDFNYWIELRNLSIISVEALKRMYGENIPKAVLEYVNIYTKPLRFTGHGFFVETFEVWKDSSIDEGKKIDQIIRERREFDTYDIKSYNKLKPTWRKYDEVNDKVQQRINEILSHEKVSSNT